MILSILNWWLALQLISLVSLPFTNLLFQSFPLNGYPLNKTLSVLLVGYVSWLLAMLGFGSFKPALVMLTLLVVSCAGLWVVGWNNLKLFIYSLRSKWQYTLAFELFFLVLLLAGLWLRWHGAVGTAIIGTEKPMELAFLSAVMESPTFPPHDPWLAGYAVNYYYLGYVLIAAITVISGTAVGEAFNLGIATIFALSALTITGLLLAMTRFVRRDNSTSHHKTAALVSVCGIFFVLILGNQAGVLQKIFGSSEVVVLDSRHFMDALYQKLRGNETIQISPAIQTPPNDFGLIDTIEPEKAAFNWWWPSRVVWDATRSTADIEKRYAITEFPFFSFYLGDLHPHVLALPFGLLAMALAFERISSENQSLFCDDKRKWWRFIITSIVLGSLYFINSWDAPTYLLIYVSALLISFRHHHLTQPEPNLVQRIMRELGLLALGCVTVLIPFLFTFQSFAGGNLQESWSNFPIISSLGKILAPTSNHTTWYAFFSIFGLSFVALLVYGTQAESASFLNGTREMRKTHNRVLGWHQWVVVIIASLFGTIVGFPLLALLPLIIIFTWNAWNQAHNPTHAFVLLTSSVGFFVILVADVLYIRDPFENRMNTVFKMYYQAWVIFGVMVAFAIWRLLQQDVRKNWFTPIWIALVLCLACGGMVYPIETLRIGRPWIQGPMELNGFAFLERQDPDEAKALEWIRQQTSPNAIILTAVGSSYDDATGRVASATGRPTLLGWSGSHERLWRSGSPEILAAISERERDIPQIYTTTDWDVAAQLLKHYGVDYVYIGSKERQLYPGLGLEKFEKALKLVFAQGTVQIYQIGD